MDTDRADLVPSPAGGLLAPVDEHSVAVPDLTDGPTAPGQREHRLHRTRSRWPLRVAWAVGVVALVVALVVAFDSHDQLNQNRSSLTATRAELVHTRAQVTGARRVLGTVTTQSAAAARTLASVSAQLAADQAQLARAQADLFTNGVSISQLDTCLAGVEQALNQIALGNESGAESTLDGVASNCRGAEPAGL